jgi:carbon storage regulator
MLVLTREVKEGIVIDKNIKVTVVSIIGNRVKLGIEAPDEVNIRREELEDSLSIGYARQLREATSASDGQLKAEANRKVKKLLDRV